MKFSSPTALLRELIRIPSVNPAGLPGTDQVGEERCATTIADFLGEIGAEAKLTPVLPGRPNVVGKFPADRPGKPRLLFAPHTDTVSVAGMTIDPFGGETRDGRIWGRGASDTKGSIAAMLWALYEERASLAAASYEIWFAGLAGEEAGQQGAKALAQAERFDFIIAGEPTGMDVVHAHKGCSHLHLVTHGKAVHASNPDAGENAIYKMLPVLEWLRDDAMNLLAAVRDPLLGAATLSVGTIAGGSKTNIVPDRCEVSVDIRTVPGPKTEPLLAEIETKLRELSPGLVIEAIRARPLYTDPEIAPIRRLVQGGARCVGAPWFCDAAVFAQQGMAAIAMGPGSIAQAHTEDEWIEIEALELGVERFRAFLRGL